MHDSEFEQLVEEALGLLPKEFADKLDNVAIITSDWPSRSQSHILGKRGERGLLLGLYEGIPQTRRGRYGIGEILPDKITIFKIPILMISRTPEDIRKNVLDTVIHEIAHHFGLNEMAIRNAKKVKIEDKVK